MSSRLLIVSNRLPISISRSEAGDLEITRSTGGLATGLGSIHDQGQGLWIGWPGITNALAPEEEASLRAQYQRRRLVPVALSEMEVQRYYEDFCNGVVWPLFHYLIGQLPLEVEGFDLYETVNRRFADAIVAHHRPGDLIWIHDYQLMLVPQLVRDQIPDARIGFFLHIPFPSSDLFRALPFRERLLQGVLGADLIGFHTAAYMRHFASSVLRGLGAAINVERLDWDGRTVGLGVFPMGVDAAKFSRLGESSEVLQQATALREGRDLQILIGIDRLDYTKGIPRRLLAFERLLRDHADLRERVRLVQVAVPSRTNVEAYQEYRDQVDALIGRINGAFATPTWTPIHYIFRGLPETEVAALYRGADVMLVTPLRDGMNLVAKEFVATRVDEGGVLVLSEFAGAAAELAEAVQVNPFDVASLADAYHRALTMPAEERQVRMRGLRNRVMRFDVQRWADTFLKRLAEAAALAAAVPTSSAGSLRDLAERIRAAPRRVLFLDYDGTLVPFASLPDLARPDDEARALLSRLAARPDTEVHVVSGRSRADLQRWLGELPIHLHAEHGLWSRAPGTAGHTLDEPQNTSWMQAVRRILREYADRTPGSLVEEKTASLAWHYRMADPEFGSAQANELRLHLTEVLSNTPVEILPGDKVIEIRSHGVHKGRIVAPVVARCPDALLVAIGDDRTDEDLFAALPPGGIAIHVGPSESRAPYRLAHVRNLRAFLWALVQG